MRFITKVNMTVDNGVKHWTFICQCPSATCGRKIRVRFHDQHVWEVKVQDPDEGTYAINLIEGKSIPDTKEGQEHAEPEINAVKALADQFLNWLLNKETCFEGVE
jgi:hypothetical protein